MENRIRILCIDDDHDLSAMLDLYKKKEIALELVATVNNLNKSLEKITKERPDIVVLDLSTEGTDPLETIRTIGERFPKIRIIVYSGEDDEVVIKRAIEAGACKHVSKDQGVKRLLDAIYEAVV